MGPNVSEQGQQCPEQEMVYILLNDNDADAEKGAKNLTVSLPNHEVCMCTGSQKWTTHVPTVTCRSEYHLPRCGRTLLYSLHYVS